MVVYNISISGHHSILVIGDSNSIPNRNMYTFVNSFLKDKNASFIFRNIFS